MGNKIIGFIYDGSLEKRPKKLQNNVFVWYLPKRIKLRPEFMKLSVRMPELIIATCIFYPHFVKMDFVGKAFNISQQTTFAMLVSLLTYCRKYILNWLIEVQILFLQYAKNKSSVSLLP